MRKKMIEIDLKRLRQNEKINFRIAYEINGDWIQTKPVEVFIETIPTTIMIIDHIEKEIKPIKGESRLSDYIFRKLLELKNDMRLILNVDKENGEVLNSEEFIVRKNSPIAFPRDSYGVPFLKEEGKRYAINFDIIERVTRGLRYGIV